MNWLPPGQKRFNVHRRGDRDQYHWVVRDYLHEVDRRTKFLTEAGAIRRAALLNEDLDRFQKASTSDHYVGYVKTVRGRAAR